MILDNGEVDNEINVVADGKKCDEIEAIGELELGLELELVCNLTLKDVKELKHRRGRKGSESV